MNLRTDTVGRELRNVLGKVEIDHEVATGVEVPLPLPRLTVESVGLITLPLQPREIQALISESAPAPFGQGAKTIVDSSVRNFRQIDPSKVMVSSRWTLCGRSTCHEHGHQVRRTESRNRLQTLQARAVPTGWVLRNSPGYRARIRNVWFARGTVAFHFHRRRTCRSPCW